MKLIAKIALVALALLLVSAYVPGVAVTGIYPAIIAAAILGILNAIVRPIFILLTLPLTILSLGFFILIINAALFYFVASFVDGFRVSSFLAAFFGALVVSVISTIGNRFL